MSLQPACETVSSVAYPLHSTFNPSPPQFQADKEGPSLIMTNFHDPKVVRADGVAFVKLLYIVGGIYIWEFFSSLWFEWQIITRKRGHHWSIWLYSGCRFSALFAITALLVGFNVTTPINCRAWLNFVLIFTYLAFAFASALIILHIVAIWERKWVPCTLAITTWTINISFYIRNIIQSKAIWVNRELKAELSSCLVIRTNRNTILTVLTLGENLILLSLMFSGLRRYRDVEMNGLWCFIHHQGLLWLALVIVAELPATIFLILNLNGYFNQMFQMPKHEYPMYEVHALWLTNLCTVVIMTIGASRIYRSLSEYTRMAYFNQVNAGSILSLHSMATSDPPMMGIQFNRLSRTNTFSTHSCAQLPAPPRLQTGSHPHSAQLPLATPPLAVHSTSHPPPAAIHSSLPPPTPSSEYSPPHSPPPLPEQSQS